MVKQLGSNYLNDFYGDTTDLPEMTDSELNASISSLIKIWAKQGDYSSETDPSHEAIFIFTRQLFPYTKKTTCEVASILGISPRRVRALAKSRGIGTTLGRIWIFTQADVEKLKDRKPGNPLKVRGASKNAA